MKFFKPKKVDLTQEGLAKVLGELEANIISCIWDHEHTTAREICDCMNQTRKISFNAVNTVLNRMVEKNILLKKKDDSYYYYTPAKSQKEFAKMINKDVFNSLLKDNSLFSYATFIDFVKTLPAKERQKIKKLLEEEE